MWSMSARFCHAIASPHMLRWWEGHVVICVRGSVTSLLPPHPPPPTPTVGVPLHLQPPAPKYSSYVSQAVTTSSAPTTAVVMPTYIASSTEQMYVCLWGGGGGGWKAGRGGFDRDSVPYTLLSFLIPYLSRSYNDDSFNGECFAFTPPGPFLKCVWDIC